MTYSDRGKIRILIVEDQQLLRESLVNSLENEGSFKIVAEADSGTKTLELYEELKPDFIILDIGLPDMEGLDIVKRIRKKDKLTKILMITMYNDINKIQRAIKLGVNGYLFKITSLENLIHSIKSINLGNIVYGREVNEVIHRKETLLSEKEGKNIFSEREIQVLKLLAEGLTSKQIADKLNLSHFTIDNHRKNMLKRTGVNKTSLLIQHAFENGIL